MTMGGDASVAEVIEARKTFGKKEVLRGLSLRLGPGSIHALLGPNGAGKTTTLRILAGLVTPTSGSVRILGRDTTDFDRRERRQVGLIPSGDRSFYLRLSGVENLVFFARLHGLSRREAVRRAEAMLGEVGLDDAAKTPVGLYSHGMQKRLSAARALIVPPALLLVDEATHDLDPDGASRVRGLISDLARQGMSVLWATQRLEEIRGFVSGVTVLNEGEPVFSGSVPALLAHTRPRRFVLRVRNGGAPPVTLARTLQDSIDPVGTITAAGGDDSDSYVLDLLGDFILGDALARLTDSSVDILACREERSAIEEAFLSLTRESA
jgi:ABC-2 type transport system ATP-binding protein